ncbi:hypothetical protein [Acinetobacter baumannii]|uniref:hypothetical protein n=1 Tax=Acinetobacter baumannii TaxID=470 RepID=UPI00332B7114
MSTPEIGDRKEVLEGVGQIEAPDLSLGHPVDQECGDRPVVSTLQEEPINLEIGENAGWELD